MICYNENGDDMKKSLGSIYFFSVIFLIIDQVIKIILGSKMLLNQTFPVIKNFFSLTLVHNTGAAFNIFTGNTILLITIGIICVLAISIYVKNLAILTDFDIFVYSLLLGGTLGNLVDRIVHGYVIDYLSFNFFGYQFPIFNFADMCIVVSIILLIAATIKGDLWK